jgi:hypothetical protein
MCVYRGTADILLQRVAFKQICRKILATLFNPQTYSYWFERTDPSADAPCTEKRKPGDIALWPPGRLSTMLGHVNHWIDFFLISICHTFNKFIDKIDL